MKRAAFAILMLLLLGGAYLLGSWSTQRVAIPAARKVLYYVDPMNPALKSDKPGIAPCGMELVPVYDDGKMTGAGTNAALPPGTVQISPEGQQLIGVRLDRVKKASGTRALRALGRVALDEVRVFRMTVPADVLVREAGPIVTGSIVKKDEVLATFYNRDFVAAQQSYLLALNSTDRLQGEDQLKVARQQLQAAEENLEYLGMGKTQLQEVARTRQIARNVEFRSPVTGLVLVRNVFPGLRFDRGTELFRIADISRVWIVADVFEGEAESLRPGTSVTVSLHNKKETLQAKVSNILPQFDGTTRTINVRLEVDNPGLVLRPDMFVDVELPIHYRPTITVAADAVLESGTRRTVFVDRGSGIFESRQVETGWRSAGLVEIRSGLKEGERIVVAGTFLLDSESRMKTAASVTETGHRHEGHTQSAMAASETGEHKHDMHSHEGGAHPVIEPTGQMLTPVARAFAIAKDPICGMEVDIAKATAAGLTIAHEGTYYYFCSEDCKLKFSKDPKRYITAPPQSPDPRGMDTDRGHRL